MKRKIISILLFLVLCVSLAVRAFAAEKEFVIEDGVLVKYNGKGGEVTIPDGVTVIGDAVFWGRTDLTKVTIPDSVREIVSDAFIYCSGLTQVILGENVECIGAGAFQECSSLTEVNIPKSVWKIGGCAFEGTPWAESQGDFIIANGILFAYQGAGGIITVPEQVTIIGESAFGVDRSIGITLPDGVCEIREEAFRWCPDLVYVTIPSSVTKIGNDVFFPYAMDDVEHELTGSITIYGEAGSYAARYAEEMGIPFMDGEPELQTIFSDVKPDDYFFWPVTWAVEQGIVFGTGDRKFSPAWTCSLGEIMTFLWRGSGFPQEPWEEIENPYEDIDHGYYFNAALWAHQQGMASGPYFRPDTPCTRAMTVDYLWQMEGCPEPTSFAEFADVPADAPYAKAVAWAVEQRITNGTSATEFSPEMTCTRGQIVTFLYRALAN